MVIPIPDSGIGAAIGYAQRRGIPFELGLIRNHYVGRTFIEPEESIRHFGVKLKLNAIHDVVRGKRIVVIDDSIGGQQREERSSRCSVNMVQKRYISG